MMAPDSDGTTRGASEGSDGPPPAPRPKPSDTIPCDICGSPDTVWIKCKLVCTQCHSIVLSCGDL